MATESGVINPIDIIRSESGELASHLEQYGYLVADILWVIVLGAVAVYLLHRLASGFLYSLVSNSRAVRVMFGALYVLILVAAVLGALRSVGLKVDTIGSIAVLAVLVGAVVVYFIIPFLPRLPFMVGHMIETNGVMGTVDQVSSFHTTIRKFDGTLVFLPNALVMASKILNYSYTPSRRIEMQLSVPSDSDAAVIRERVLAVVRGDERVLDEPSPPAAFVMAADASAVHMTVYCWVRNEDFLAARSDLWLKLMALRAAHGSEVPMALPRQVIELSGAPVAGGGEAGRG
jgi:small conductance mechanosensitive channel